jgi:hypothetical protein
MKGDTYWVMGARPDGTQSVMARLVDDGFESKFVLLTRVLHTAHRLSLRYDTFEVLRDEPSPAFESDSGHAWTVSYRYERSARLSAGLEWLEITSQRDPWSMFYALPRQASERQLRLQVSFKQGAPH